MLIYGAGQLEKPSSHQGEQSSRLFRPVADRSVYRRPWGEMTWEQVIISLQTLKGAVIHGPKPFLSDIQSYLGRAFSIFCVVLLHPQVAGSLCSLDIMLR